MTIFSVRHITSYRYVREVEFGEHRLMFRPRDSFDQRLIEASLTIYPEESHVRWIHDVFGNCVALINISRLKRPSFVSKPGSRSIIRRRSPWISRSTTRP